MAALITRCPACATMFKVVPDQLRVSEGWVRCGHCGEVFDAGAHLQDADAVVAARSESGLAVDEGDDAPAPPFEAVMAAPARHEPPAPSEQATELPSELASELPADAGESSVLPSHLERELADDEPDPVDIAAQAQTLIEHPLDRPFELRREDLGGPVRPVPSPIEDDADEPAEEAGSHVGFLREARRQAQWRNPAVRALLVVTAIVLAALLALQIAVQERDRLAASDPGLRPWLSGLCAALECRIGAPRQIESIAIDSSSFNKLRTDAYRLQVTLKNQARTEVAMPSLELTLTDSDEQPVVRRVLMPAEFGANRATIAATSEWSGGAAIALTDTSLASRVAGYRLLAFYP